MEQETYIGRVARKAWDMTRADVGLRNKRTAIAKIFWVLVALLIMYLFGWHELAKERTGEIVAGLLAFAVIFLLLYVINFFSAPSVLQNEADETIKSLETKLFSKEKRQEAITSLWDLRKEGVDHRNKRINETEIGEWNRIEGDWYQRTLNEAENVSLNLRRWLETLDRVREPPQLPPAASSVHNKRRRFMSEVLSRMEEFLEADMLNRDIQHWDR